MITPKKTLQMTMINMTLYLMRWVKVHLESVNHY